jgi:hypothetical protein
MIWELVAAEGSACASFYFVSVEVTAFGSLLAVVSLFTFASLLAEQVGKVVKTKRAKAVLVAPNICSIEGEEGEEEYPVATLLQVRLSALNSKP